MSEHQTDNPYDTRWQVVLDWEHPPLEGGSPATAAVADEADEADERTDFDLIHRKLDHAISAAFFCGGMFGLAIAVALFAIAVLKR